MRRIRLRTLADLDKVPEGEWVEVIGPTRITFSYETRLQAASGRLVVRIPRWVRDECGLREGEELRASLANGTLVVRRAGKAPRRRRRAS